MAWFSGKVSLGNFPDLAGAVNKLSESVKNIEKNFDSALGLEEKPDSSSEGIWPVMSFMGKKSEDDDTESSGKIGSPQKFSTVDKEETRRSMDKQSKVEEENQGLKEEKEEHQVVVENTNHVVSESVKHESESEIAPVEPPESVDDDDVKTPVSVENQQEKENSDVGPADEAEPMEVKSGGVGINQMEDDAVMHDESYTEVDNHESKDEQKMQTETVEEGPVTQVEASNDAQAEPSSDAEAGDTIDPSGSPVKAEEVQMAQPVSVPTALPLDQASEIVPGSVSGDSDANIKTVVEDRQASGSETDTNEQRLSSASNVSDSVDSAIELEKVKLEMKMMESALQGAARQAQAKADEIAKLMNENENLKTVISDLKRKSNDAEIESLREEYHQRVATLERKVYALTKERDTLRREQNKKSDAAVLLKEKDEIISQVMAEGEELSKKQAAQESTIRKLRAQIRELEEEKKGLATKLQVEENKVESIKMDKTATEKLLQETIEKHQGELAAQKEYYTNALAAAKEAEALAEARANNEARSELESRLREAEERESMLVQALEELRQTLSRKEQQAVFREDMLRRDIEDLEKRYQASERRCEELVTQVPESTRPLLRQIEAIQETMARRAEAWSAVERSLNSRLQEAEAKAAAAEERERSVNERLSQTLSRINVLEAQISCLRAEQTQLSRSLEKERQRAAENRQEYLAAKEEADTQEGRANQLEEEIKQLRQKHKQELQDAIVHKELLQQEIEKEKAARLDLERSTRAHSTSVSDQSPVAKSNSGFENGTMKRKLSSASSLGSIEESYFLQASLDTSDNFSERRNPGELSPYYMKSMTPSAFEAALRQKEGELTSYISRLASMESIRDSLAEELVKMTAQCEKLRAESGLLPGIRAELEALRRRHSAALELMGERDEELEELRADIVDLKEMYREQVNLLVNRGRGRDTGGYPSRGGRSSQFSDSNSRHNFQKDDVDGSFSDDTIGKRFGRGRGRGRGRGGGRSWNMHQNSPGSFPRPNNYRPDQGFQRKQKNVTCNSESTQKDQNALNFSDCELDQPESFAGLESASSLPAHSNLADAQTHICPSNPELGSSSLQSGATSTAVSQSRICLSNQELAGSYLQSGCMSQSSQDQQAKNTDRKGDSGNIDHLSVTEPFEIFQRKTGGSVMLNPSLLDVNRRKRNESKLASQVQEQILRPGMVLLKKFLSTNDQVKIVKFCRDVGLGHGGFYQPGYSDGAKLRLKMMCLGKNWDPDTSKYVDERPIDGSKPPSIPPEFHQLVEKALKHSCALMERDSKTRSKGDIPWMTPDLCIVNFYSGSGRLGLHQDKDESKESLEKGLPVVSFSIGDAGEFLYSDKMDENAAEKVLLESGDVLIFGGKSRHVFHGVSVIQKNTAPKPLLDETNLKPGRLNLTFRKY